MDGAGVVWTVIPVCGGLTRTIYGVNQDTERGWQDGLILCISAISLYLVYLSRVHTLCN